WLNNKGLEPDDDSTGSHLALAPRRVTREARIGRAVGKFAVFVCVSGSEIRPLPLADDGFSVPSRLPCGRQDQERGPVFGLRHVRLRADGQGGYSSGRRRRSAV